MHVKIIPVLAILMLSVLLTGCGSTAFAQSATSTNPSETTPTVTRTLSVSGNGKVYMTPDIAYVTIGVHTEGEDAIEAVASNNGRSQKVIDTIKQLGIPAKDIQTNNFNIYPQQQYDTQGKPTGKINYQVDNSVFVTVRDIDKIGKVLNAAVQNGANSISGIQFDVADKTKALSEARKAAVMDARTKAEELASAAGVTLGEVQTINEYTSGGPIPMYDTRASAPVMVEAASVPVQPGQMILTIDVNIVYEIR